MSRRIENLLYVRNVIAMERFRAEHRGAAHITQKYLERCGLWGRDYNRNFNITYKDERATDEAEGIEIVPEAYACPGSDETPDSMFDWHVYNKGSRSSNKIRPVSKLTPLSKLEPIKKDESKGDDKGEGDDVTSD